MDGQRTCLGAALYLLLAGGASAAEDETCSEGPPPEARANLRWTSGELAAEVAGELTWSIRVEAEWQVRGQPDDWLGRSGLIGDLDGDGAQDLAVAAPRSIYLGTEPGHVLIWPSPQQGVLDATEAPIDLVSGVRAPDAFGMGLEGGDFDGDGLMDLAIGAPRDPTVGSYAGSVTVVFGASL